jgi:hypothetical protein
MDRRRREQPLLGATSAWRFCVLCAVRRCGLWGLGEMPGLKVHGVAARAELRADERERERASGMARAQPASLSTATGAELTSRWYRRDFARPWTDRERASAKQVRTRMGTNTSGHTRGRDGRAIGDERQIMGQIESERARARSATAGDEAGRAA